MVIRINKTIVYWIVVFVLEFGFLLFLKGGLELPSSHRPSPIEMSQSEADLVVSAISLVLADIDRGVIKTTDDAIAALRAELPTPVADSILRRIGHPEFKKLTAVLRIMCGKIKVGE